MIYDDENFPELPQSWMSVSVADACRTLPTPTKIQAKLYLRNGSLPVIDQGAAMIGGYTDDIATTVTSELPVIVFGDHTRVLKYVDFRFGAGADGIKVLRPESIYWPKTLFRFLQAVRLPDKGYARHFQHLRAAQIALPPFAEQKRIAEKLDSLLARVNACRERLNNVPAILRRFRQSVLVAATTGRLTAGWRIGQGLKKAEWQQATVGALIDDIEAGLNVKCAERPPEPNEKGLVKISAVTWGTFNDNESKTVLSGYVPPEKTRIHSGDFLISRANTIELVGACVITDEVTRPVYLSDKVLRLAMPEDCKHWLLFCLRSPAGRQQIESLASGNQSSMRNLSQANLRSITVPLPSPEERAEITRRVKALLDIADRLDIGLTTARSTVERLTPSLLAKAFRGELVPQDRNDEPAAELLKRLAEGRSATGVVTKNPRGRKATRPVEDEEESSVTE